MSTNLETLKNNFDNYFSYTLEKTSAKSRARAGVLTTPHGKIETPVFMPVGTNSSVKTLVNSQIKDTKAQYKLNRTQRLENLSNAFEVNKEKYKGKTLLIIDDICTTGSTFEEMIKELNKAGIIDIVCFATSTPKL